jgi:succinate dehydrogenase hydrophobic anchor subunit
MATHIHSERSIPELFSLLFAQMTNLLRKESQLARVEMSEKMTQIATALALVVGGAALLIPALVVLLNAAVAALIENGFTASASALIVGGITLVIGAILVIVGIKAMKANNLMPDRTIHQLQRDAEVAKHQVRHDHEIQRAA